jgi:uncharacterized membrane protein
MSTTTPRSVEEYLRELRTALEGADPALIQDALYDAEEHLRAEIAAHPDKSEAQVLESMAGSYGAPEEVAAAYRETEAKVTAALRSPRAAPRSTPIGRFFGVYADPRAYAGLVFMLLTLATGILYFTVTVVGLSLSAGLAILIIGVPVFLTFIGITRVLALVECRLVEAVSGVRMPRRPVHPGPSRGFWQRMRDMVVDSRTWTTLAYNLLMLPVGIAYFVTAIVGISVGLACVAAPLIETARLLGFIDPNSPLGSGGFHFHTDGVITPYWLGSPLGLTLLFLVGVLIVTCTLHFARLIVRGHAHLAKSLLVLP